MIDPHSIDRAWIECHIPHRGSMCLLDRVESWDDTEIVCSARSHRDATNPLRCDDSLGIATAIEYAAQAMAVHSALLNGDDERLSAGFLTSARNVQWHCQRLDAVSAELIVRATRLSGDAITVLYAFALLAGAEKIIDGRVSIFLNGAAAKPLTDSLEPFPSEKKAL